MSKPLFDDSDDNSENGFQLNTNEGYAKTYNHLRKKELLQKFKDKGLNDSDSESSDDSDSSEEDEVLDPTFDQEFLSTLASLKSKDPTIYDKNVKFFAKVNKELEEDSEDGDEDEDKAKRKEKKAKPVTLKDYERKIILEKGGKFVDDSDEEDVPNRPNFNRAASPTLAEEERRLRDEFKEVINANDDSGDEGFGGIFKKREKSKVEEDEEEEDYLKWLAGKKETITDDAKEKLKPLKNYWGSDKLPSSEKFLRDYILNKGYTEADNYADIPTYEEIVGDNAPLSEDEDELEKQAEFEHKYNFRFEDPDQEFIKRYPRTVETSVRRTDDKRKQKRQEIKERKQEEKQQKMKEVEMVKEMKRKEIQEKIEKLKMVTGNDELGFKDDDLEEDFDPEAHDRRMRELFNDDYYQVDEGEEKPECPSDIDELKLEDWDNYDPQKDWDGDEDYYEPHCEDDDFVMDCDYDPAKAKEELQKELIENTKSRKGRKGRRDRFMAIIKAEKPVFDPEDEKTYGEYIDEYYKLDCEDIIGDTPCRFKYVETTPNDFGLTIEEILLAKNKELNQWASLKKAIQIRPEQVEKKEQRLYKLKSKNEDLKRKIFKSLYGEGSDNEDEDEEIKNIKEEKLETSNENKDNQANSEQDLSKKAKKRRKRNAQNSSLVAAAGSATEVATSPTGENKPDGESDAKKPKMDEPKESGVETEKPVPETEANKKKRKKNRKKKQNPNVVNTTKITTPNTSQPLNVNSVKQQQPKQYGENQRQNLAPAVKKNQNNNKTNNSVDKTNVNAEKNSEKQKPKQFNDNIQSNKSSSNKNNPFASKNKNTPPTPSAPNKVHVKGNPFNGGDNSTKSTNESLPPLRQNLPKSKPLNGKFKPKFIGNKKPFKGGKSNGTGGGNDISDERLKAYGINPKKFHNKQKYGGANKQQKQE